ncbi:MAG: hypothetical protein K9N05_00620 [Candidatus Marinimicrobia bacterium]|nr:hypothetical protein [Candidatus Neomarinimicrobiota bacterium]
MKIFTAKIVFLFVIIISFIFAKEIILTTDNGDNVILHENGTWEILPQVIQDNNYDFRNINWGMTFTEVKESEPFKWKKGDIDANTQFLCTNTHLMGDKAMLVYYFNLNRVYRARYILKESHSNKTEYWNFYKHLIGEINNKYGESAPNYTGEPIWLDDVYKDDPVNWGEAIATGKMVATANWELPKSTICAIIQGDNNEIELWLEFEAVNFKKIEAKKTEAF